MNETQKRILLIIGFVIISLVMAFLIYLIFFRPFFEPEPNINVTPINQIPVNGLPPILSNTNIPITPPPINTVTPPTTITPPGTIISNVASGSKTTYQSLDDQAVTKVVLASNGQDVVLHEADSGLFYKITPDGQKEVFTNKVFKNVENISWAPNMQKAVLEYPDGSNIVYDFNSNRSITLPRQWEDFNFSNDSQKIVFKDIRIDKENRFLSLVNADGSAYIQLDEIGKNADNVFATWSPNNKYVGLYSESIDGGRAEIYPIGLNQENYRKFRVEGRDFRFIWSPSGNKIVYSVFNESSDYNPLLWVVNSSPAELATGRNNLGVVTWADKCVFADEANIYCGVPRDLPTGSGFNPSVAMGIYDDIYKININSASAEMIAEPLFPTSISSPLISADQKYLYWTDQNNGQLYKMNLAL